ncbi:MAG: hypothetical protein K2P86_12345 [Xanthobacteraceae bacterium]|jgi:hypothetical protein|nr:hypothetical protein [Xanthobacteraceae bacterium]
MPRWQAVGLFCDDLRDETRSKTSLIGIFPDNLFVSDIPVGILKIGFTVRIYVNTDSEAEEVSAKIKFADGEEKEIASFDKQFVANTIQKNRDRNLPIVGFVTGAVAGNLHVTKEGPILLIAKFGSEERICGCLNVSKREPNSLNVSEQPSSRSGTESPTETN